MWLLTAPGCSEPYYLDPQPHPLQSILTTALTSLTAHTPPISSSMSPDTDMENGPRVS